MEEEVEEEEAENDDDEDDDDAAADEGASHVERPALLTAHRVGRRGEGMLVCSLLTG